MITGGFGFLGGRIAQYLSSLGYEVFLGSRDQHEAPTWSKNLKPVRLDWQNNERLLEVCKGMNIIIHAAGMSSADCFNDPFAALEFNALGTVKLIEAGKLAKIDTFIYLSTAHIYGSPLIGSITEDTCPKNLHPYATSHLSAELAVSYAHSQGYFKAYNCRLSNGFGAPTYPAVSCWKLFVNDLCKQSVEFGKLVLNSDGNQKRDFVSISSISKMIGNLLIYEDISAYNNFNIGSGYCTSLTDMAKLIQNRCQKLFNYSPPIEIKSKTTSAVGIDLEYKVDRMKSLGLFEETEVEKELDNLLLFCSKNFNSNI